MTPAAAVLFRVAAGPRVGFGHLIRARSLSRALGVPAIISLRGSSDTAAVANALGFTLADESALVSAGVVVVDDPSPECASVWITRARAMGVPVVTLHDLGIERASGSDLAIDCSATRYTILDPSIYAGRQRPRSPEPRRVLIALGGGAHVRALASGLAEAIAHRCPDVHIQAACGFTTDRLPRLASGEWLVAPDGLAEHLSRASVAIVAGGVTLYEACALGVPAVALAVTPAQHRAIRRLAARGAVVDAGCTEIGGTVMADVADAALRLLRDGGSRRQLSRLGRSAVDGRGAWRVGSKIARMLGGAQTDAA
jgi:spore coat polysaccharide biosynthesis predicted glycosyltransferase SpsG